MGALADAYALLKAAPWWSATRKLGTGYAVQNPGEAAKIDAYVAQLDAGQYDAAPPVLSTRMGQGEVGIMHQLAHVITAPPAPTPTPAARATIRSGPRPGDTLTAVVQ